MTSVITPAFNAALTIARAHESVLLQDGAWEHIVVDDGSTDATPQVMEALRVDLRVTYLRKRNGGPGSALNCGIRAARGEYIAFLDADDEYLPDHLSAHVAAMESDPSIDILWGGMQVIVDREEDRYVPDVEKGSGLVDVADCIVQGTLFMRRRVFDTYLFTEERAVWFQDYEFVQRARATYQVKRFEPVTYRYYRNSGLSLVDRQRELLNRMC